MAATSDAGSVPRSEHVFLVVEENHGFDKVIGQQAMPYLDGLASDYSQATDYFAAGHPSIPNYFMLTTGQVITHDDHFAGIVDADNIARELGAAGETWKVYAENLPAVGYTGGDVYPYFKHHNPFAYFTDVLNDPKLQSDIVPWTQFATDLANNQLPNFSFIVPNVEDDAHDCPAGGTHGCPDQDKLVQADKWLQTNIAPLIASPVFQQDGLLLITFDESDRIDKTNKGGQVAWVAVGPNVKRGYQSQNCYGHENTLRTVLQALGVTNYPGASSGTTNISDIF